MYYYNYYNKTIKDLNKTLSAATQVLAKLTLIKNSDEKESLKKCERAVLLAKYTAEFFTLFDKATNTLINTIDKINSGFDSYNLKELKQSVKDIKTLENISEKFQLLNESCFKTILQDEIL